MLTPLLVLAMFQTLNSTSFEDAVCAVFSVSDISEINSDALEHFEDLASKPLRINCVGRAALMQSELFSSYQADCIIDYRKRCGDILSPQELGVVDGMSAQYADAIGLFIDFQSGTDSAQEHIFNMEATSSAAYKCSRDYSNGEQSIQWKGKVRTSFHTRIGDIGTSFAARSPWALPVKGPEKTGWSVSYSGSGIVEKLVGGCFNTKFGQGLACWSAFAVESVSSPESLMKKSSGISPYTSYSTESASYGCAGVFRLGSFSLSPFADFLGGRFGGNIAWHHRHGEIGLTVYALKNGKAVCSADFQHTVRGITIYGETRINEHLLGIRFPLLGIDWGIRAHYKDSFDITACGAWKSPDWHHSLSAGGIFAKGRIKCRSVWIWDVNGALNCSLRTGANLKADTKKYEARADVRYTSERWQFSTRIHCSYCDSFAWLLYEECGYANDILSAFLQGGVHFINNWNDRIYVYMRDAPGSFNIPAMYGRGLWLSAYVREKKDGRSGRGVRLKFYQRLCWSCYPWAKASDTRRGFSLQGHLQMSLEF